MLRRNWPLLVCSFLFLCFGFSLFAQNLEDILDNHDPRENSTVNFLSQGALEGQSLTADQKQKVQVIDKFLKAILDLLNEILAILQDKPGSTAKPPAGTTKPPQTGQNQKPPAQPAKPKPSTSTGESTELNQWKGGRLSPDKFIRMLGPVARESFKRTGVPASVTLAQAALETGWGGSTIGDAKNLFGIKGTGPAGTILVPTTEYVNGQYIKIKDKFRKYNTWVESVDDHSRLISQGSRYKNCMKNKDNPDQFAKELKKAGYATDPNYANKLISIMKQYDLYQWDKI